MMNITKLVSLLKTWIKKDVELRLALLTRVIIAATTLAILSYLLLFARSMLRAPTLQHFIVLSLRWQSLVAAGFAIFAAIIGAWAIIQQTSNTTRLEKDRWARRAVALRAALPILLSEISEYAEQCTAAYASILSAQKQRSLAQATVNFPSFPSGLTAEFTNLIEASEQSDARALILLLRRLQIQSSRLAITRRRLVQNNMSVTGEHEAAAGAVLSAELYARCEKLFAFARQDGSSITSHITADDVRRALLQVASGRGDTVETEAVIASLQEGAGRQKLIWPPT